MGPHGVVATGPSVIQDGWVNDGGLSCIIQGVLWCGIIPHLCFLKVHGFQASLDPVLVWRTGSDPSRNAMWLPHGSMELGV